MDFWQLFSDYTLRTIALGAGTLGIISGALGSYAVLRKQSLLGDAMSHAALPGIAIAFLITRSKEPLVLLLGAAVAGWIATLVMMSIVRHSRIKQDSALGLVLSVFFGFGLMLLTFIQKQPDASQAGLDKFLFGQATTLLERDVWTMAGLGAVALGAVLLLWKEFKLLSFDPDFGTSLGYPMRRLDILLTMLLVVAIVVGLQTVGVVLMSAMVVAPAVAARQWTDRLGVMVGLAAGFGALSGVVGALLSNFDAQGLPTGPTVVLCVSAIAGLSLLFAPNRGIVWSWLQQERNKRSLQVGTVLGDMFALQSQHAEPGHAHAEGVIRAMNPTHADVSRSLRAMESRGWAREATQGEWALTEAGLEEARRQLDDRGHGQEGTNRVMEHNH
jgi:manganese/zinc/iron transport system permease protein